MAIRSRRTPRVGHCVRPSFAQCSPGRPDHWAPRLAPRAIDPAIVRLNARPRRIFARRLVAAAAVGALAALGAWLILGGSGERALAPQGTAERRRLLRPNLRRRAAVAVGAEPTWVASRNADRMTAFDFFATASGRSGAASQSRIPASWRSGSATSGQPAATASSGSPSTAPTSIECSSSPIPATSPWTGLEAGSSIGDRNRGRSASTRIGSRSTARPSSAPIHGRWPAGAGAIWGREHRRRDRLSRSTPWGLLIYRGGRSRCRRSADRRRGTGGRGLGG